MKGQSNGSNDAKNRKEEKHRYDVTTNKQRSHYNSHALVSSARSSTGANLSFCARSPQDEQSSSTGFLRTMAVVAARMCFQTTM